MARVKKKERQEMLLAQVKEKPFLTDEELARNLAVSVQTIRLDRLELGIPELRGRIRKMAETAQTKVKALRSGEVVGELIIDAPMAVTGVADVKYKVPVHVGEKLIAKAEIVRVRGNKYFVWVKTRNDSQEVFRAKFIMVSWGEK